MLVLQIALGIVLAIGILAFLKNIIQLAAILLAIGILIVTGGGLIFILTEYTAYALMAVIALFALFLFVIATSLLSDKTGLLVGDAVICLLSCATCAFLVTGPAAIIDPLRDNIVPYAIITATLAIAPTAALTFGYLKTSRKGT